MKGKKNLQQIIFYPARLSFRIEDKIKNFPDKQAKRVYHYWTGITRNAKVTSINRKQKEKPGHKNIEKKSSIKSNI